MQTRDNERMLTNIWMRSNQDFFHVPTSQGTINSPLGLWTVCTGLGNILLPRITILGTQDYLVFKNLMGVKVNNVIILYVQLMLHSL